MSKSSYKRIALQQAAARHKHVELTCPACHKQLNHSATLAAHKIAPRDGDLTICSICRVVLAYTNGVTDLRIVPDDELQALPPELKELMDKTREALDRDAVQLICQRALDMSVVIPGTVYDRVCAKCGVHVGIALSGQRVLAERPDATLICNVCFSPLVGDAFELAPGALEEFRRSRGED